MHEESLGTRLLVALLLYLLLLLATFTPLGSRINLRLPAVSRQEMHLAVLWPDEDTVPAGGDKSGAAFLAGR